MTEKSKYVRFDWAIQRILRDEANKEVLEGLITVLLGEPVTITQILESENNKYSANSLKLTICNNYCVSETRQ